jgi:ferredoxin-NADP reductase
MAQVVAWQIATVTAITQETARVKTFTLALPTWTPHRAGQHYDLRLTAPDGYQAQRSYSIASPPERTGTIDLTVERLDDGEVSSYLHEVIVPDDQIEVRGPIGGYFVWDARQGGPLLLLAGGSGLVPLMAMIRHRAAAGSAVPTRLLYSVRAPEEVIYAAELERRRAGDAGLDIVHTFTRRPPPGWTGYARRIDAAMLQEVAAPLGAAPQTYICGPTLFVEAAATGLTGLGVPPDHIRTERFGPTGGTS